MQKQHRVGKRGGRRPRQEPPKVWHNPDVVMGPQKRAAKTADAAPAPAPTASGRGVPQPPPSSKSSASRAQRIVSAASPTTDPKVLERERLLARLVSAEGRPAITRAADAVVEAGFELPDDQGVQLQMLEHSREAYVQSAIEKLAAILALEPCKRQTVLESRLRRLEEFADEQETRSAARDLRRKVSGARAKESSS